MTRVLFYFYRSLHIPILLPIYEEMRSDPAFEIAFAYPPPDRINGIGLNKREEAELRRHAVAFIDKPRDFRPDVSVMADNVANMLEGCGRIVNVGHGLICKGYYYSDSIYISRENLQHVLCVPGSIHRERLEASGRVFIPVVETGVPKLDQLFRPGYPSRNELMSRAGLDPKKRLILYAPTFNIELSAIPILWTRIRELASDNNYLIIKLHGVTSVELVQPHIELAKSHPNIIYAQETNLVPYMKMADVMVSDVSSASAEFIALDKPVVLFNNPNQSEYEGYNPKDIEYEIREACLQAQTLEEVKEGVSRSLSYPDEFSDLRREWASRLLADMDGTAAARTVEVIRETAAGRYEPKIIRPKPVNVLIPADEEDELNTIETIASLFENGGDHIKVFVITDNDETSLREEIERRWPQEVVFMAKNRAKVESALADSPMIIFAKPGVKGYERWVFRLVNHLRENTVLEGVVPMALGGSAIHDPIVHFGAKLEDASSTETIDRQIRFAYIGQRFRLPATPRNDLWAVRAGSGLAAALIEYAVDGIEPAFELMQKTAVAVDTAVNFTEVARIDTEQLIKPLSDELAAKAEKRVSELASWIGSIIPSNTRRAAALTAGSASRSNYHASSAESPATENGGLLRLILHYESIGKVDKAIELLKRALDNQPRNSELEEAAKRLGVAPPEVRKDTERR